MRRWFSSLLSSLAILPGPHPTAVQRRLEGHAYPECRHCHHETGCQDHPATCQPSKAAAQPSLTTRRHRIRP